MSRPLLLALALVPVGCTTVAPATRAVDPDTLPNCTRACSSVGMKVSAVVFIENYGGCVCEPAPSAASAAASTGAEAGAPEPRASSAGAGGGVVAIMEARRRQEEERRRQQASSATPGHR